MPRLVRIAAVTGGLAMCALSWLVPDAFSARAQASGSVAGGLLGGVNLPNAADRSSATLARELAWAHTLDAKVVRVEVPWSQMEPSGPGQLEPEALAAIDRLVADAHALGIKVIMLVESTPCWDSSAPAQTLAACKPKGGSEANAWPPVNDAYFGTFMAYLAQRYGPDLAALEVWNEPDQSNEHYLAGPGKAAHYVAMLRAAYTAIKAVAPTVPVLGGSLVGSNGAFLRLLYKDGMKGYYDGLSVHFYNLTLASLRSIHEVQLQNGDDAPLWLNEFGYTSCWPHESVEQEQACVTPELQAADLASVVRAVARTRYVTSAVVYKLQDSRSEDFGMVTAGAAHKPSFAALADAFASPTGSPGDVSLTLRRSGGRVLAQGSAPPGDFLKLQVREHGALRYYAVFKLNRFNRYSIPLPSQLGTSGLSASVYQYSLGPSRAAQKSI